jgi:hypothetical protein
LAALAVLSCVLVAYGLDLPRRRSTWRQRKQARQRRSRARALRRESAASDRENLRRAGAIEYKRQREMLSRAAPPGWYDDPDHTFDRRWWSGADWTNAFDGALAPNPNSSILEQQVVRVIYEATLFKKAVPPYPILFSTADGRVVGAVEDSAQFVRGRELTFPARIVDGTGELCTLALRYISRGDPTRPLKTSYRKARCLEISRGDEKVGSLRLWLPGWARFLPVNWTKRGIVSLHAASSTKIGRFPMSGKEALVLDQREVAHYKVWPSADGGQRCIVTAYFDRWPLPLTEHLLAIACAIDMAVHSWEPGDGY